MSIFSLRSISLILDFKSVYTPLKKAAAIDLAVWLRRGSFCFWVCGYSSVSRYNVSAFFFLTVPWSVTAKWQTLWCPMDVTGIVPGLLSQDLLKNPKGFDYGSGELWVECKFHSCEEVTVYWRFVPILPFRGFLLKDWVWTRVPENLVVAFLLSSPFLLCNKICLLFSSMHCCPCRLFEAP